MFFNQKGLNIHFGKAHKAVRKDETPQKRKIDEHDDTQDEPLQREDILDEDLHDVSLAEEEPYYNEAEEFLEEVFLIWCLLQ